jgi:O-antigen/teichoic acid export membrane protein
MTDGRPGETDDQRADRNFGEILQELRVAATGVQVLFGFLITMPVQPRFERLDSYERGMHVTAVIALAIATACLIAPVAWHRVLFQQRMKTEIVEVANRLVKIGLLALGIGLVASVLLVFDLVFATGPAIGLGVSLAVLLLMLWLVAPLRRRDRSS